MSARPSSSGVRPDSKAGARTSTAGGKRASNAGDARASSAGGKGRTASANAQNRPATGDTTDSSQAPPAPPPIPYHKRMQMERMLAAGRRAAEAFLVFEVKEGTALVEDRYSIIHPSHRIRIPYLTAIPTTTNAYLPRL